MTEPDTTSRRQKHRFQFRSHLLPNYPVSLTIVAHISSLQPPPPSHYLLASMVHSMALWWEWLSSDRMERFNFLQDLNVTVAFASMESGYTNFTLKAIWEHAYCLYTQWTTTKSDTAEYSVSSRLASSYISCLKKCIHNTNLNSMHSTCRVWLSLT